MISDTMPSRLEQAATVVGLLLAFPGVLIGFGLWCLTVLIVADSESDAISFSLVVYSIIVITVGAGGSIFWRGLASQPKKVSGLECFPSAWRLASLFGTFVILGALAFHSEGLAGLLFSPFAMAVVALPATFAVSPFLSDHNDGVTWRRSMCVIGGTLLQACWLSSFCKQF